MEQKKYTFKDMMMFIGRGKTQTYYWLNRLGIKTDEVNQMYTQKDLNKLRTVFKGKQELEYYGAVPPLDTPAPKDARLTSSAYITQKIRRKRAQFRIDKAKKITYKGKTQTISEWAEELNIKRTTLDRRIFSGWSIEEAFTTPVGSRVGKGKGIRYGRSRK